MLRKSRLLIGSVALVAVVLLGCSGDDDESVSGSGASSSTTEADGEGGSERSTSSTASTGEPADGGEDTGSVGTARLEDRLLRSSDLPPGYREEEFQRDEQSPCSPKNLGIPDAAASAGIRFVPDDSARATVDELLEERADAVDAFTKLVEALRDRCREYAGGGFTEIRGPEVGDRSAWFQFIFGSDPSARVSGYFTLVVSEDVLGVLAVSWLGEDTDKALAENLVRTAGERLRG